MCIHVCLGMCAHVYACMWRPKDNLWCVLLFFWEKVESLTGVKLVKQTKLVGHSVLGICLSWTFQHYGHNCIPTHLAECRFFLYTEHFLTDISFIELFAIMVCIHFSLLVQYITQLVVKTIEINCLTDAGGQKVKASATKLQSKWKQDSLIWRLRGKIHSLSFWGHRICSCHPTASAALCLDLPLSDKDLCDCTCFSTT